MNWNSLFRVAAIALPLITSSHVDAKEPALASCKVGSRLDNDQAVSVATAQRLDVAAGVRWSIIKPPPRSYFQNRFTACMATGQFSFLMEEVDTQAPTTLRQTQLAINKVDTVGHVEATQWINGLKGPAWGIGLGRDAQSIYALTGERNDQGEDAQGAMQLSVYSPDLQLQRTIKIPHGSFLASTRFWVEADGIYIVGPFAKTGLDIDAQLAVAKLTNGGKYVWSTRIPGSISHATYRFDSKGKTLLVDGERNSAPVSYSVSSIGVVQDVQPGPAEVFLSTKDAAGQHSLTLTTSQPSNRDAIQFHYQLAGRRPECNLSMTGKVRQLSAKEIGSVDMDWNEQLPTGESVRYARFKGEAGSPVEMEIDVQSISPRFAMFSAPLPKSLKDRHCVGSAETLEIIFFR